MGTPARTCNTPVILAANATRPMARSNNNNQPRNPHLPSRPSITGQPKAVPPCNHQHRFTFPPNRYCNCPSHTSPSTTLTPPWAGPQVARASPKSDSRIPIQPLTPSFKSNPPPNHGAATGQPRPKPTDCIPPRPVPPAARFCDTPVAPNGTEHFRPPMSRTANGNRHPGPARPLAQHATLTYPSKQKSRTRP